MPFTGSKRAVASFPVTPTSAPARNAVIRRAGWLIVAALAAAAVIYLLLWYGPDLIARHDVGTITGTQRAIQLRQARDAARGRLLTLGAGLFAAGALLFTGQNYRLARQTLKVTEQGQRRTLELTEQGQVTDRYTKAIGQLGSKKLDVRIGGIYALERIASDSPRDHPTVMEVLAAFVREHSREQGPPARVTSASGPIEAPAQPARPDVQAALTVIGRRNTRNDRGTVNLTDADLTGANLQEADLRGAFLIGANLRGAFLMGAKLGGAFLDGADLTDACLIDAVLVGALLNGANLLDTDLANADITRAIFTRAKWPPDEPAPVGWVRDLSSGRLKRAVSHDES